MNKPLILITNDDGLHARGIKKLIDIAKPMGDVYVVAPDRPQSGMSHAITVATPLRLNKIKQEENLTIYTCSGTPVDSVKLALDKVVPRKPDIVLSGINHGMNSSVCVIYSGTMGAALEGAIERIPSIGFSVLTHSPDSDFDSSEKYVKLIIEKGLETGLPEGVCLNVNIPTITEPEIKGVKVCRQAKTYWSDEYLEHKDPHKRSYYWLTGVLINPDKETDTDEWALENNYISVVPVHSDLTAHEAIPVINKWRFDA